ncbi:hypothetical protein J5N97_013467 [Dioscorea zingiberensis]|uniref:Cysteine proteinase inhibitor n=1 Tax=Dioscorea zingiberensis TaxID=325984 RepID=A0A9D5CTA8_9LILI|nr:hypothetical protein J5N97_013467 [Dioscorea zingiberensis]
MQRKENKTRWGFPCQHLLHFRRFFLITASLAFHRRGEEEYCPIAMALLGGVTESDVIRNSAEIEDLARFAVDEHNKKENKLLEFVRVVKAKEQVVGGMLHYLTVEAIDAGSKKLYEAKVFVRSWLNIKELKEFNHTEGSASITASDLGIKRDGHEPGWRTVPVDDPAVKDAANHVLKMLQQSSNSIDPYELLEILHAKAEVIEDSAKFDLLLKFKLGSREEKHKMEVHKTIEGTYHLNQGQKLYDDDSSN